MDPTVMDSTVVFESSNFGLQIGNNYGPINNPTFHLPSNLNDKLPVADGAAFGSYADQHEDECLDGTRTDILRQIREWASSPQRPYVFWLNGMAGTGKSTISRTIARVFRDDKSDISLGASFFFKRGEGDRGLAKKLFSTIARQLATSIPRIIPALEKTILDDPDIAGKTMRDQFERLILYPLQSLKGSDFPMQTMVIVIDALDECEGDRDIKLILQLLFQLQKLDSARLLVFLTSRPELPIRLGFSKIANHDHKDLVLHEIPEKAIKHDLTLFLNSRISEIRKERQPPLPKDWPGNTNFEKLVALSFPLFIFAATICRIFEDPIWDPMDSLTEILTHQYDQSKLDQTYLPVLDRLLNGTSGKYQEKLVSEFQQVIGAIVILESPLSVNSLSKLLELPESLIQLRLSSLHSVLRVPESETEPVRLFHLSFRDFILDPETRKKTYFGMNERDIHYRLAKQCLLMCQNLRKNICKLPSYGIQRAEVDRQTINIYLPPELQYACRYWTYHLVHCAGLDNITYSALLFLLRHFLREKFLNWVEAMGLLNLTSELLGALDHLETVLSSIDSSPTLDFLHDAKRFILKNRQMVDQVPLQVYRAGLVFAPRMAIIREQFKNELPSWICQLPRVEERWGPELQTLEGHLDMVQSVAFSPDGRLLASGSADWSVRLWDPVTGVLLAKLQLDTPKGLIGMIAVTFSPNSQLLASGSWDAKLRLWDPATGVLQQTLEANSGTVNSVAFSPDSRLLATGCGNKRIQLWDLATGMLQHTLEGHLDWVNSVVFSPDSRLLASGSRDKTVRLWDSATGVLQQTLEGHSDWVWSVTFSPNGKLLASGSKDKTVRLWDSTTGVLRETLEGHLGQVLTVSFSPSGRLLGSGSSDKSIRLWDPAKGMLQQTLEGHARTVNSVAFSPDGRLLVSGSWDRTVRVWDLVEGSLQQSIEGHSDIVSSMAFSPDGRQLASASKDTTVRLWDPATGVVQQTLKGHLGWVIVVAFSPNGRLLASGSNDMTVRVWDSMRGALQHTLTGHSELVRSVAFSPNGWQLASSSNDKTVRLWNLGTGVRQQTLIGHSDTVSLVTFSPDGRLLASSSWDKSVRLWNSATGVLQQIWTVKEAVKELEFCLDIDKLLSRIASVLYEPEILTRRTAVDKTERRKSYLASHRV
ncbi:hypothetical protein N7444_011528 [Penicillium canescens]|nr:hypothetical protein N7444_011528 [Penicillium canescens]